MFVFMLTLIILNYKHIQQKREAVCSSRYSKGFAIPANGRKTIDASRRICKPDVHKTST